MKRFLAFLMTLLLVSGLLLGCSRTQGEVDENTHTEYEGIYLTVSARSVENIVIVWHNDTVKEAVYGEYYHVEKYNEGTGEWESVLNGEFIVAAIGILLEPHSERIKLYSLEQFDLSEAGKYRFRSDFSLGDGKTYNTWAEFDVKR